MFEIDVIQWVERVAKLRDRIEWMHEIFKKIRIRRKLTTFLSFQFSPTSSLSVFIQIVLKSNFAFRKTDLKRPDLVAFKLICPWLEKSFLSM